MANLNTYINIGANTANVIGNITATGNVLTSTIRADSNLVLISNNANTGNTFSWTLAPNGTTACPNYTFPVADGSNTQILTTNGNSILSWSDLVPVTPRSNYGAFHYDQAVTLVTDIPNGTSTANIVVTDNTAFPTAGTIMIQQEFITYTGKSAGTTFTGITRSTNGTSGASHAPGEYVTSVQATAAQTRAAVNFNVTDYSNGVILLSPDANGISNQIQVTNPGMYNLQFSIQVATWDTAYDNATIWFAVNGTDVPASASVTTVQPKHGQVAGAVIMAVNLFQQLTANSIVQLYWTTDSGNSLLVTSPPNSGSVHPSAPAIIFTVNQIF